MEFSPTDMRQAAAAADKRIEDWYANRVADADRDLTAGQAITKIVRESLRLPKNEAMPYEMRRHINRALRTVRERNAEEFTELTEHITIAVQRHYQRAQDSLQFSPSDAMRHQADLISIERRINRAEELTEAERGRAVAALREGHKHYDRPLPPVFLDQEPLWASRRGDPLRALAHQCRTTADKVTAEADRLKGELDKLRTRAAEFERPEDFRSAVKLLTTTISDLATRAKSLMEQAARYTAQAAEELVAKTGELKARVQHKMSILRTAESQIAALENRVRALEEWQDPERRHELEQRLSAIEEGVIKGLTVAEATAEIDARRQLEADAENYEPLMNKADTAVFYKTLAGKIFDEIQADGASPSADIALYNLEHGDVLRYRSDGRGYGDRAEVLINQAVTLAHHGERFPYPMEELIREEPLFDRAEPLLDQVIVYAENGEQFMYPIPELIGDERSYERYALAQTMDRQVSSPEQALKVLAEMGEILADTDAAGSGCRRPVEQITTTFDHLPENAAMVNDLEAAPEPEMVPA